MHTCLDPHCIYLERENKNLVKIDGFDIWWEIEKSSTIRIPICLGNPPYIAPEVTSEQSTQNQQTVIYTLGAILYECLVGRPIFTGDPIEKMIAITTKKIPPIAKHNPYVSPQIQDLINKMLAKEPLQRYHSFSKVLYAWEKIK